MRNRVAMWAGLGFLVAAAWAFYAFIARPDFFLTSMQEPLIRATLYLSCPIAYVGRYYPIPFWRVLFTNAATYALVGFIIETFRARRKPAVAA